MERHQLDPIDVRILKELTLDARIPLSQLAKNIKVSNTLVHQRIKKLKESGILKKATFEFDPWLLGYESSAYVQIILDNSKLHRQVEQKLKKIPEIVECVNVAGRYALIVKIFARNNRHLRDIIYEKIQPIDGIEGTNTIMSFELAFQRNVPINL